VKVYVVCGWVSYEGNSDPEKVFDSEQKAKDYIANAPLGYNDGYDYFELDVE
jgi:hypothetical protein